MPGEPYVIARTLHMARWHGFARECTEKRVRYSEAGWRVVERLGCRWRWRGWGEQQVFDEIIESGLMPGAVATRVL
jgi:hypothetical protein